MIAPDRAVDDVLSDVHQLAKDLLEKTHELRELIEEAGGDEDERPDG